MNSPEIIGGPPHVPTLHELEDIFRTSDEDSQMAVPRVWHAPTNVAGGFANVEDTSPVNCDGLPPFSDQLKAIEAMGRR